ncbi:hypothetical protein FKM82_012372 [Ascaphus truei]
MLPSLVRKWLNRPKKSDPRLLSQFFYVDEEVTGIVNELHCMDLRKDPQNYLLLLTQLHNSQERLLGFIERMLEQCVPTGRQRRDYQLKFPDEIVNENMTTHLLFAAELLVAGTYVEVEEADGVMLRPLAQELLSSLEDLRHLLREQSLEDPGMYPESIQKALLQYDNLCAEFELRYVSLVVSVKTPEEIYKQQEVVVLFCETVSRALQRGYLNQEMIDGCEPELMISIPRLAIISGLLIYPDGPLNLQRRPDEMCKLFSPFYGLLQKIRELLCTLTEKELFSLERVLCSASSEDPSVRLSCLSASPDTWKLPSYNGQQSEHGSSTVTRSGNPTPSDRTTWECTAAAPSQWSSNACHPAANSQRTLTAASGGNSTPDSCIITRSHCSDVQGDAVSAERGNSVHVGSQDVQSPCVTEGRTALPRDLHVRRTSRRSRFQDVRSRYRSDSDMLHRLFVCIAGVADQLQTNFASDLRIILKTVFEIVSSKQQEQKESEFLFTAARKTCVT